MSNPIRPVAEAAIQDVNFCSENSNLVPALSEEMGEFLYAVAAVNDHLVSLLHALPGPGDVSSVPDSAADPQDPHAVVRVYCAAIVRNLRTACGRDVTEVGLAVLEQVMVACREMRKAVLLVPSDPAVVH